MTMLVAVPKLVFSELLQQWNETARKERETRQSDFTSFKETSTQKRVSYIILVVAASKWLLLTTCIVKFRSHIILQIAATTHVCGSFWGYQSSLIEVVVIQWGNINILYAVPTHKLVHALMQYLGMLIEPVCCDNCTLWFYYRVLIRSYCDPL